MQAIDELKLILREKDCPFFEDSELEYYLGKYPSVEEAAYHCLLRKAENTTLSVAGLNCADSSKYFLRLAQGYRPTNSCTLKGG